MAIKEVRSFTGPLELETRESGRQTIRGYAAVFNSESVDFGYFREVIKPGAFARSLKENPDVRALLDHDTGQIIGRVKAGNLKLSEDDRGLKVEIEPTDSADGQKALSWVRDGLVDGMSFGFQPLTDDWSMKDGKPLRSLIDVNLFEVSLVAFPAYPATSAHVRSASEVWAEHAKSLRNSRFKRLKILQLARN